MKSYGIRVALIGTISAVGYLALILLAQSMGMNFSARAEEAAHKSGPYAGLVVGYDVGRSSANGAGQDLTLGGDGAVGGALIGWNFWSGNLMYGVEADITASGLKGTQNVYGYSVSVSNDWQASVRARAGMAFGSATPFVTAGVAWAKPTLTVDQMGSISATKTGWVAGGGVDLAITNTIGGRIEALYYAFPSQTISGFDGSFNDSETVVRAGLTFKLN